jgi:hypothetical protein
MRGLRFLSLAVGAVVLAAGCIPSIATPGTTSTIQLVSTTQMSGWQVDLYRNVAYPCSISGYQTFAIGTPIGLASTTRRPLWTYMHGGGVGFFDSTGTPQPNDAFMREEGLSSLVMTQGLMGRVFADPAGFRVLSVSMCNRDLYGGGNLVDPNNPNLLPNGARRTSNGLMATKAAIQFARSRFATDELFLHGGSAGSAGTYSVAWALQQQGIPPAGIVADSYVVNQEFVAAVEAQSIVCPGTGVPMTAAVTAAVRGRLHPAIGDPANQPDRLVSSGRLTVPILQVWSDADPFGCDGRPMQCPMRDGTFVTLGGMDCMNEPLRRAIAAQGPSSRSLSLGLCVNNPASTIRPCNQHVVTSIDGTNTDPSSGPDYNATIMAWVHARLADA